MMTYAHGGALHCNQLLRSFRLWESNHELSQAETLQRLAHHSEDAASRIIMRAQAAAHQLRAKQSLREAAR